MKNCKHFVYLIVLAALLPLFLLSCAKDTTNTTAWKCGSALTINHVAGAVAPVSKTVTYGIVTNIPGEPTKCWLASNLGADHQATSVDDTTETSAGWHWQFNKKQGYKYDGTTRTPNTAWNNDITDTTNWLPINDPCTIELGSGWRLPTSTEWSNVDASGNWNNWNGPWNSSLKLHAAGHLSEGGSLSYRGFVGSYWSSTQIDSYYGWDLSCDWRYSGLSNHYMVYGFSVRCLRD